MGKMVLEERCEDAIVISTELTDYELMEFYRFATNGVLSSEFVFGSGFSSIGIDLDSLSFDKASAANNVSLDSVMPIKQEPLETKSEPNSEQADIIEPINDWNSYPTHGDNIFEQKSVKSKKILSRRKVTKTKREEKEPKKDLVKRPRGGSKAKAHKLFDTMMANLKKEKLNESLEEDAQVCIACGDVVDGMKGLRRHIHAKGKFHTNECPKCPDVEFISWEENKAHRDRFHGGVIFIRCRDCPKGFENADLLKAHNRTAHPHKYHKINCSQCGVLVRKAQISSHNRAFHSEQIEVKCKDCPNSDKVYENEFRLKEHIRRVHTKVQCEECGQQVYHQRLEMDVLQKHTPDADRPFKCLLCNPLRGFALKQTYEEHMNIHTGEKPFKCEKGCHNIAYACKANLFAHYRATHQGIKRKYKGSKQDTALNELAD